MKIAASLLLIVASVSAQPLSGQAPNPATDEVPQFSLEATSFIDALLKVSARFRFPLGVEWVKTPDTLKPVRFSRSHTTVKDVINAVVSMYPGYDWRTEDGSVHVFQRQLEADSRNPLSVSVKDFGLWNDSMTIREANSLLAQLVSQTIYPTPIGRGVGGSFPTGVGEPVFLFAAQNVPARKILNQIVTSGLRTMRQPTPTMNRIWIATFPQSPAFTRTGFLEVVPMWNLKNKSNQDQPFWILLRWGDPALENMVQ